MDPIAIYAAVVSTVVLLWDGVKWYSDQQAKLDVYLSTGMVGYNLPQYGEQTMMVLRVTNRSNRATTITHMTMQRYESWWAYVRRKAKANWIVHDAQAPQPLPFVLEPGKIWSGIAIQSDEVVEMATGYLCVELIHALAKKSIRCRVVIRDEPAQQHAPQGGANAVA